MVSSEEETTGEISAEVAISPHGAAELTESSSQQILLQSVERRSSAVLLLAEVAAVAAPLIGIGSTVIAASQGTGSAELAFMLGTAVPLGIASGAILESSRLSRSARKLRGALGLSTSKPELQTSVED